MIKLCGPRQRWRLQLSIQSEKDMGLIPSWGSSYQSDLKEQVTCVFAQDSMLMFTTHRLSHNAGVSYLTRGKTFDQPKLTQKLSHGSFRAFKKKILCQFSNQFLLWKGIKAAEDMKTQWTSTVCTDFR